MKKTLVVVLLAVFVFVGSVAVAALEPEFVREYQIEGWKSSQISVSENVEPSAYQVAEELRQYSIEQYDISCEVIGRANKTGTFAENEVISDGRANNVASFLRANVFGLNVYQWAGGEQADVMRVDVKCKFYVIPIAPVTKEEVKPEIVVQKQELSPEEQQELARGIAEQLKALQKETPEKPAETVSQQRVLAYILFGVMVAVIILLLLAWRKKQKKEKILEAGKKHWAQARIIKRGGAGEAVSSIYYTGLLIEFPDRKCQLPFTGKDGQPEFRPDYQIAKKRLRECILSGEYEYQLKTLLNESEPRLYIGEKETLVKQGVIKDDE